MKKIYKRIIPILFFVIIYSYLFLYHCDYHDKSQPNSIIKIKLNFVGDVMCHLPQIKYAQIDSFQYDFKPSFRYVKSYIENADLSFANLETVIGTSYDKFKGYPNFNSPPELIEALKYAGFDILFTSNNHSYDQGYRGIINTLNAINNNGIIAIGSYKSKEEYDSLKVINLKNVKIGVLAYSYGLNINPKRNYNFAVKIIDTILIKREIEKMIQKKTDLILVYFHFGNEYEHKISSYQKEIVNKTFDYGADIIIASHPHVVQPIMFDYRGERKCFVAYSLGNFISNQQWRFSDSGVILSVIVTKNFSTDRINIDSVFVMPVWVYKGKIKNKNEFVILPCDTNKLGEFYFLGSSEKKIFKRSYYDVITKIYQNKMPSLQNIY